MNSHDISINTQCCRAAPDRTRFGFRIARVLDQLAVWHERARRRRELVDMPDHLLKDMGVSREEVDSEIRKPFWRP